MNTLVQPPVQAIPWQSDWMRAEMIGALRSDRSRFPDKYDLAGEERMLRDAGMLNEGVEPDAGHPLYARLVEYEARSAAMSNAVAWHTARAGADSTVTDAEASRLKRIGGLTNDGDDSLLLHTRDAYRLFMGRAQSPDGKGQPAVAGGRKAAAALLAFWNLASGDNPYADWLLIQIMDDLSALRDKLSEGTQRAEQLMQQQAQRGLAFRLVKSSEPQSLIIGFRSPYGYEIAQLIADFDWSVRHIRTLAMKAMVSTELERSLVSNLRREARACFEKILRWQRVLMNPAMLPLTRSDWLPQASEEARKRVRAATEILGEIPRDVFNFTKTPKHHKMSAVKLSPEEMQLLNDVPLAATDLLEGVVLQKLV